MKVVDESKKVVRAARAATITSLGRAAAYIRGIARRSISTRKSKKPSEPGKPPKSPTGKLKNAIFFAVDRQAEEALIGPTLSVIGRIGQTHEFGGEEPPKRRRGRRARFDLRVGGYGPMRAARGRVEGVARLATTAQLMRAREIIAELELPPSETGEETSTPRKYPPRPFMGPALTRSRERLPDFWKNSIKRS